MNLTEDEAKLILNILDTKITETKDNLFLQALEQIKEKIKNYICYC